MKERMREFAQYTLRPLGITALLIATFATLPVWGHAILVESTPAASSIVRGPSVVIRLRFNSRIDGAHSRLYINTDAGTRQIKVDSQRAPDTVSAKANDLTAGEYQLRWQVLSVDGHITRGEIPFTVR
jgi:methionine-rich copper-binding protein CopC